LNKRPDLGDRHGDHAPKSICYRPTHVGRQRGCFNGSLPESIDPDSQFDLAAEAEHEFALAALRRDGYRSEDRITVYQTLTHTIGVSAADLQVFLKAHSERNLASYQGRIDINEKLLADLIAATERLSATVAKLSPPAA
jgi:hypothetical protein